ncbi:hypothetical protein DNTS_021801 [Danionella cerebrum]|uniref:Uncharacterized protein n=1 Tax=Danionella cerebrum TaxID=2873325 RepID=A0A553R865_9TELE|nr:hypothetical protein DNTS_021801 [Danionella translucida]
MLPVSHHHLPHREPGRPRDRNNEQPSVLELSRLLWANIATLARRGFLRNLFNLGLVDGTGESNRLKRA